MNDEKLLDRDTIIAAVSGEKWAVEKVVERYNNMIDELATEKITQPDGNIKEVINEDKRQEMILALIDGIKKFPLG